jgi:hypothetical protein
MTEVLDEAEAGVVEVILKAEEEVDSNATSLRVQAPSNSR